MSILHRNPISNESTITFRRLNPRQLKKTTIGLVHTVLIASMLTVNLSGVVQVASAAEDEHIPISELSMRRNEVIHPINDGPIETTNQIDHTNTTHSNAFLMPSMASSLTSGRVIYEGPLSNVDTPIAAIQGHMHALQIAFEVPNCGNCGASGFIGDHPDVWPSHILEMCFTGYGPAQQCTTKAFRSPGNALYVDIWDVPWIYPQNGIVRVVDLDLSPGIPLQSALSDCQPKDGQGDPRECQVNGSSNTQGYAGDPINTQYGGYHISDVDLSINTAAGPLVLQRTYSSLAVETYTTSLGPGWTHNHDTRLIFPDDPSGEEYTVWFKAHTANLYRFQIVGNGTYSPYPGVLANLKYQKGPPARYILTDRAQQTYIFDGDGKLLTWTNAVGNSFHYVYDENGRLSDVQDDTGDRFLHFNYDEEGHILEVSDHSERLITFSYDTNGDLVSMQDVLSETWSYTYDEAHHLLRITDPRLIDSIRLVYDEQGRVIQQFDGLNNKTVELSYDEDGETTLLDALGNVTKHIYDTENGVLIQEINAQGGVTQRTYDRNYRVESITDPLARTSYLEWSDDGHNLERTIDAAGSETVMDYNATNRLEQVTDPLLRTTFFNYEGPLLQNVMDTLGYTTSYIYTTEADAPQPPRLLKQITDPRLHTTDYFYNAYGDRTQVIDGLGYAWSYHFNELGWLTETINPQDVMTLYLYDDAGHIAEVMENYVEGKTIAEDGEYNILTQFRYDEVGNLELLIDTLGKVTFFAYDDANRLIRMARNYVPTHIPDSEFNVTTQFHYDELGNQIAVIDPLGTITRTYYDSLNRPITVVENIFEWDIDNPNPPSFDPASPDRNVPTWYAYDDVGNLLYLEDALGTTTRTCYDVRNLPHKSIVNPTVPDPCQPYAEHSSSDLDIINQWSYDAAGNLLSWKDPLGSTTSYSYDDLNRLETITNPLGFVTTYDYDPLGNLTSMTDAEGVITQYQYDALSQLSAVIQNYQPSLPQDHETNVTTSYVYDPAGNMIVVKEANEGEWSYFYDGLNRLRASLMPQGGITGYSYDALDNLIGQVDPNMNTIHYNYDLMNRLIQIDYADPDPDVLFTYDEIGNLLSMLDGLGTTTWEYDGLNRPTSIKDPFNHVIEYTYNAIGHRTGMTYADGKRVSYTYDAVQRLSQVQDWDNGITSYAYDKAGQPKTANLPNGVETSYTWDAANRLETLNHQWNAQTLASYEYSYDRLGNRTQALEYLQKPTLVPEFPYKIYLPIIAKSGEGTPGTTINYTYDPLYRLTAADYSSGEFFHYSYDAVGNRLTQETREGTNTYTYDAKHRITEVDGVTYNWDPAGNLLSDGERTFTYDHADRLTSVSDGSSTYAFTNDGLGNRYQQSTDGSTTTYSLDVTADLTQVLGDGTNSYLYGLARIGEDGAEGWQYPLPDALGSTRQLTDPSGDLTLTQYFEPFGAPMKAYGDGSSDFGFTGEQDSIANLVFLRARYYDPGTGRFITKDPFSGVTSLPNTLHPYQYALNNPINLVDPSGEFVFIPWLINAGVSGLFSGGMAALSYILSHPGQDIGDILNSGCFWRAVGIGFAAGIITGLFTGVLGGLGIVGTGFWGTVGIGTLTGAFFGGLSETLTQLWQYKKIVDPAAIITATITGAISGAIFGAIGFKFTQAIKRGVLSKGLVLLRKPTGGWKFRIFKSRAMGATYEIFHFKDLIRIEAHPTARWMPRWFFRPHIHLDFLGPQISKIHIPIVEPILLYIGYKIYSKQEGK